MALDATPHTPVGIDPIMRMPAVLATVCMSRSWLLASIKEGTFPAPVRIGAKAVGWRASAVTEWLRTREELGNASLES